MHAKVKDVVIVLIDQEREGQQIDRALLKNVLDILVEIGMGKMDYYEADFESPMLTSTASYYSRKASNWIEEDSCPDYMLKSEECLKREKDRVSHYLHSSSEQKLLDQVQHELLTVYTSQLLEKEYSGCYALLRDDKVEDLSRTYRLFSKIPCGLEPVSSMFKQHVTVEGTALVKQAEDALTNKKGLEDAIPGTALCVVVEDAKDVAMKDMNSILSRIDKKSGEGVCVQDSTFGSVEDADGTTNCFVIFDKGILIGIDSRAIRKINDIPYIVDDNAQKYKILVTGLADMPAVGITAMGDSARIKIVWDYAEQLVNSKVKSSRFIVDVGQR